MAFPSLRSRPAPAAASEHATAAAPGALVDLVRGAHLEVLPTPSIAARCADLPIGTTISVTCSPVKGIGATLEVASALAAQGHSVIPHLAARMVDSHAHLDAIAATLDGHGIRTVFLIGGDAVKPAGPYADSLAFMRGLVGTGVPLERIGTAGYPDGHASIPGDALARALADRQRLLADAGIGGWISTQMCFEVDVIARWAMELRASGITLPLHLGVPGAVETAKLLTLGMRIGVGASLRYLRKNRAAVRRMAMPGGFDPMELIAPLAPRAAGLGIEALHVFTFNQVEATAAWRRDVLAELTAPR
jgi:methylenetetrahydrofolate reductase (NADPH)